MIDISINKYTDISNEVLSALEYNKPIVALESTIISHGMPYPQNMKTAIDLENIIKLNGAVPATIAIINGRIKIGLTYDNIEFLSTGKDIIKVSRRDIPYVIAMKKSGSTTVSATMVFAAMYGIKVFATGGIGGVHRGAEKTFDISADLTELSQTSVAVVCAGPKSILDIGLTLEKLETFGVPVLGYKTNDFPAFYLRSSGFKTGIRVDTPLQCANILKTKWDLNLKGGIIIANPIPEKFEGNNEMINSAIETALKEAEKLNISGKKLTPFLLSEIEKLTDGKSLEANIALVNNNADLAAKIAVEYNKLL
jgi:pseudouridine-5'-phosphate glycosidase